jgi:hypothetical protein
MVNFFASRTFEGSAALLGATAGAAGWIFGASENLATAGHTADAHLALFCSAGVFVAGGTMWLQWLTGRRLNLLFVMNVLLAASILFGGMAVWMLHSRGVLAIAVNPSGKYPEWLAWLAPIVLVAILASTWYPPLRRRLLRTKFARHDSSGPQSLS